MLYLYNRPGAYTTSYKVCFVFFVVVFVTDSFPFIRNQNCFRRKPTEQTLILPYLIFAHWQTQGESSLDQLLTILWIQSNPTREKWLLSQDEALPEVSEAVHPMQRASDNQGNHLSHTGPQYRTSGKLSEQGSYQIQFPTCYEVWEHSL